MIQRWFVFGALLAIGLIPQPARAYLRQAPEDSIEWTVFDSDVIVRGVVSQIETSTANPSFTYSIVTISVNETFKGSAAQSITFLADTGRSDDWRKGEHLFFLIKTPRYLGNVQPSTWQAKIYGSQPLVLRNAWQRYPIALDAKPDRPVFDAYLHPLESREAILAAVRYETQHPPATQFGMLEIQISATSESFIHPIQGTRYQPAYLNLLIDGRAEVRAREWVKSADAWDRWNGAEVLSHFQSPRNIALLKPLLEDPYKADGDWPLGSDFRWDGGTGKWRQAKSYPMRNVAYNALKNWQAAPPEAVLYDPVYPTTYLAPQTAPLVAIAAVLLLALLIIARWVRRLRYIGGFTAVSILLLAATASLWLRSHWLIDELSIPTSSKARSEIASIDGTLRFMQLEPSDQPTPASFISVKRGPTTQTDWDPTAFRPYGNVPAVSEGKAGFKAQRGGMWAAGFSVQNYHAYTIPLWSLCVLFAMIPAFRMAMWLRERRRPGENCCQNCGYDLRATPDKCPECGLIADAMKK